MSEKNYAQFSDPMGLAKRLLLSGRLDAWWGLGQVPVKFVSRVVDSALAGFAGRERGATDSEQPTQIFIIGGPRSGTTLCHQVLVRHLNVTYFSNFTDMFPKSAVWLSHKLGKFDQNPSNRFSSFYGVASGFRSPSDGFAIWNQWLGEYRYGVQAEIDSDTAQHMRSFFQHWQSEYPLPFMNKNNRNVDCAIQLAELFPNAHFVEIRRDPIKVAKSLLAAREFIQGNRAIPWGLHSEHRGELSSPVEQVCHQILSFTRQLDANAASIPSDRYHQIDFDDFLRFPASHVRELCEQVAGLAVRDEAALSRLSPFTATRGHARRSDVDDEHRQLAQLLR